VYGVSKLCLETLVVTGNDFYNLGQTYSGDAAAPLGPMFSVARYGNFMGLRGSVVHVFKKQIAVGGIYVIRPPPLFWKSHQLSATVRRCFWFKSDCRLSDRVGLQF